MYLSQRRRSGTSPARRARSPRRARFFTDVFFFGDIDTSVIKIDKKLGTATASVTLTASESTYDSCTGKQTQRDVTLSVSLDLDATTGTTSTKTRSETTFPDGSKEITTGQFYTREAAGGLSVGGTSYTAVGQIGHEVETDVIVPPPHH